MDDGQTWAVDMTSNEAGPGRGATGGSGRGSTGSDLGFERPFWPRQERARAQCEGGSSTDQAAEVGGAGGGGRRRGGRVLGGIRSVGFAADGACGWGPRRRGELRPLEIFGVRS